MKDSWLQSIVSSHRAPVASRRERSPDSLDSLAVRVSDLGYRSQIFRGLEAEHLDEILSSATTTVRRRGELIFQYGDPAEHLFVVLSGMVSILLDPSTTGLIEKDATTLTEVSRLGPGCSFGELAMLNGQPRSATAVVGEDDTQILSVPLDVLSWASEAYPDFGFRLMRNLAVTISSTVQNSDQMIFREVLSSYFVRVLSEEISSAADRADPLTPIQTSVTLRDSATFLGGPHLVLPEREEVELLVFGSSESLRRAIAEGSPSGEVVFNVLFFLIRNGTLPHGTDPNIFSYSADARASQQGSLSTVKSGPTYNGPMIVEWELKGSRYDADSRRSSLSLLLHLHEPGGVSTSDEAEKVIASVDMKIQRNMEERLPQMDYGRYRVLTLHHRTHEVARTLRSLHELGFQLDAFIGIPYGDVSWAITKMLDHASNRQFRCLKAIVTPGLPTRFVFDHAKSSLLPDAERAQLDALYRNSSVTNNYMSAMNALVEVQLERSLLKCRNDRHRLLIFEDGGYVVPLVHEIFHDREHRLHDLVREAVEEGVIAGALEVTTAGERRTRAVLQSSPSGPLVPVLSTAREDVKLVYESIGVAEAVMQSASTALGSLGLPSFGARRVAVVGGNGAIGVRVVEKLVLAHNSAGNTFSVDVCDQAFRRMAPTATRQARQRTAHMPITVVPIGEDEVPLCLDGGPDDDLSVTESADLWARFDVVLSSQPAAPTKMLVSNAQRDAEKLLPALARRASERHGYELLGSEQVDHGARHTFVREGDVRSVTLLGPNVVFQFNRLERLIRSGIDTVIGVSGLPVVDEGDFNAFLVRDAGPTHADQLVLVSGSSKDYEFQRVLVLLNRLITLLGGRSGDLGEGERVASLAALYNANLCFMDDDSLQSLRGAVLALSDAHPNGDSLAVAAQIAAALRKRLAIRRDVRPEVGSVYQIDLDGCRKSLVMLADGFVVNFFASFEKGVKTEYIDPIVTMQMLGLVRLADASDPVPNGLHPLHQQLREGEVSTIWSLLDDQFRPLDIGASAAFADAVGVQSRVAPEREAAQRVAPRR